MTATQVSEDFQVQLQDHLSVRGRRAANSRWQRLEPVKDTARQMWLNQHWPSRAEAVRTMRPLILKLAMDVGEPLSPDNAFNTIESWLKQCQKPIDSPTRT